MTKTEYCKTHKTSFETTLFSLDIKGFENENDCYYVYYDSFPAIGDYHKAKIYYNKKGIPYFKFSGTPIYLNELENKNPNKNILKKYLKIINKKG